MIMFAKILLADDCFNDISDVVSNYRSAKVCYKNNNYHDSAKHAEIMLLKCHAIKKNNCKTSDRINAGCEELEKYSYLIAKF